LACIGGCWHQSSISTTERQRPAGISPEGAPIYALSDDELTGRVSNVSVTWANDDPDRSSVETFYADGRYVLSQQGDWILNITKQGRFWIKNRELCWEIASDGSGPICRRFGRSQSGAVYELPARGRETIPRRYEFTSLEGKAKP
jgi:hypothetical protein